MERRDAAGADAVGKVSLIDAGALRRDTAYAAINTLRLDDLRPHIYRTHDGGKTWTEIVARDPRRRDRQCRARGSGAAGAAVRRHRARGLRLVQRRRTLAAAAAEHAGDVRSATSSSRTTISSSATHGRAFWILDDITPLRQIDESRRPSDAVLFKPQTAWRVRWNTNTDTPLPPEKPAGQNPPDGAIIDYYLEDRGDRSGHTRNPTAPTGGCVRRYASTDPVAQIPDPPARRGRSTGIDRRSACRAMRACTASCGTYISSRSAPARAREEASEPSRRSCRFRPFPTTRRLPRQLPGHRQGRTPSKLTVDGKTYSQPIVVKQDPR